MGAIDVHDLDRKVRVMYKAVAENPTGRYHFEMGRGLAERLGYSTAVLDRLPPGSVESFAGVGYFFDLLDLQEGEHVLDLGSGSGMDAFAAAAAVGASGSVTGVDMTVEQLEKAERLRAEGRWSVISFVAGRIEHLPFDDGSFDVVISNGVINLSPSKETVFAEAARVLRPGGRLAIADIVTERPLTEQIVCDTDLWASCIGGATHQPEYRRILTEAGFVLRQERRNDYRFLSRQALGASETYGVRSVSILAERSG